MHRSRNPFDKHIKLTLNAPIIEEMKNKRETKNVYYLNLKSETSLHRESFCSTDEFFSQ
jgi:hypothetical protein